MKLGIMQPYLFPYIGYFQLISACDKFVVHDDIQYIQQGWINRNYITIQNRKFLFVFSVRYDDHSKNINERFYTNAFEAEAKKLLRNIDQSYSKAPYFIDVRALLVDLLEDSERNVAKVNTLSIRKICKYLGIDTEILISSEIEFEKSLMAEGRVIAINKKMMSTHYINPIGGMELYSKALFKENEIDLFFLQAGNVTYPQLRDEFVPNLSIIDVMMFNSPAQISRFLQEYTLV